MLVQINDRNSMLNHRVVNQINNQFRLRNGIIVKGVKPNTIKPYIHKEK